MKNITLFLDQMNLIPNILMINQTELADLISSNKLKNERRLIPFEVEYLKEDYKTIKFEGGEILHSANKYQN